ncbi:MAG: rod shape-determining protein MreC [Firmicutes bacterium]|nr:rod shape-determining protein MreC [Bacillota bacterium]
MPDFFSRRSYLVLIILIAVSIFITTVHYREGEDGLIHRSERLVMAAISPLQAAVTSILTPVKDGWDYLVHFGDLKRENRGLKQEIDHLREQVFELQSLKRENSRLRSLIGFKDQLQYETIPARVIGMPASNWWSSVIIDKGYSDGVRRHMPVIAGGSLIGQVVDVTQSASKVTLLNDVQSGVSVQVESTGEIGVVKGQLRENRLSLRYISRDSAIQVGDRIVTSGLGGLFPRGLYVGKVSKVTLSGYGLYKNVEVMPPVDFSSLEEVLVVKCEPITAFKEGN